MAGKSRFAGLTAKLPIAHNKRSAAAPDSDDGHMRSSQSGSLLAPNSPAGDYRGYDNSHGRTQSPTFSDQMSSNNHGQPQEVSYGHDDSLVPPVMPFNESGLSSRRSSVSFLGDKDSLKNRASSLSLNYVPSKFTRLHAPGDYVHRRKQGGGRDAFGAGAQRMGQLGTVDDDEGMVFQVTKQGGLKPKHKKAKLRWNRFKWALFTANSVFFLYSMATLVSGILVWLNVFYQSDVIRVGNRTELIISTVAASMMLFTSLLGFAGIFLNHRSFLAFYTLLLWIDLALLVTPGYLTYKQRTFNLEGKVNLQWSRSLGTQGRLRIQDALQCCGYYSPFVEATVSPLCYARSNFPGCKSRYIHLERHILMIWYAVSFALVPAQILVILAGLLCSNHVTYRFGKGLTPMEYRLNLGSMAVIMDEYAGQIAAVHGPGIAQEAMERSSYNLTNPRDDASLLSVPSHRNSLSNLNSIRSLPVGSTRGLSLYDPSNPRASNDYRRDSNYGFNDAPLSQTQSGTGMSTTGGSYGGHHRSESAGSFTSDDHHRR